MKIEEKPIFTAEHTKKFEHFFYDKMYEGGFPEYVIVDVVVGDVYKQLMKCTCRQDIKKVKDNVKKSDYPSAYLQAFHALFILVDQYCTDQNIEVPDIRKVVKSPQNVISICSKGNEPISMSPRFRLFRPSSGGSPEHSLRTASPSDDIAKKRVEDTFRMLRARGLI